MRRRRLFAPAGLLARISAGSVSPRPSWRRQVYEFFHRPSRHGWSAAFHAVILGLIALNILALVLETVPGIRGRFSGLFLAFETLSVTVFTVEYVFRLWSCTASPAYAHPVRGRLRFALQPLLLADLLSILPFYLPFLGVDARFLRAARLLRFLRAAKLGRYSHALQLFGRVLSSRKEELLTVVSLAFGLLLAASALLYLAEHRAQPDQFSSIPAAMWWGVTTLTSVGYGDLVPVTPLGKLLASIVAVLGIGLFAMPAGLLGAAFVEEVQRGRKPPGRSVCPHCGREIDAGRALVDATEGASAG